MVENFDAAIAFAAVEGIFRHTRLAKLAKVLKIAEIEAASFLQRFMVQQLDTVGWVDLSRHHPQHSRPHQHPQLDQPHNDLDCLGVEGREYKTQLDRHEYDKEHRHHLIKRESVGKTIPIDDHFSFLTRSVLIFALVQLLFIFHKVRLEF